jgi:ubiquinone/menaquinone biosynthesis C-methylase UbiE
VELNPGRAAGMERLTRRVGLRRLVAVVRGDAIALPFAAGRFDACVSEEAFLHVADKDAVLTEARRVLATGGRLAFTDWITHPGLGDAERARLEAWMAAVTLQSIASYRALLGRTGFRAVESEDLTDEWRGILKERLLMYRALREDTVRRLGEARYREYDQLYAFFVRLVDEGKLGGGRFSATR